MSQPSHNTDTSATPALHAASLSSAEARYRALIVATGQIIWTCAPDGDLTGDTRAWCAFTGQTPCDAVGPEWLLVIHPDDRDAAVVAWHAAMQRQALYEHECRVRRHDGEYRDMLVRAAPMIDASGSNAEEWTCICVDITERKRLEQQNRAALAVLLKVEQIVTEPTAQADMGLLLSRVAEALWNLVAVDFAHAMGVSADNRLEPLGMYGVAADIVTEWRERVRAFDAMASERGPELLAHLSAGHPLVQRFDAQAPVISPLVVAAYQIRAAITVPVRVQERLIGLLTVSRVRPKDPGDTDFFAPWDMDLLSGVGRLTGEALTRMRLSEQLTTAEAAQLAAEATTRQRDEFLSIASHELRTPLTSVSANIQMLTRYVHDLRPQLTTEATAGRAERLENLALRTGRQVRRLNRLVNDLLDISRIEAGKLDLRADRCDLLGIVTEAAMDQRDAWPDRTITLDLPAGDTLTLNADADRIGQVVTNLLTNALKYSAATEPVAVLVSSEAQVARVAVSDHGPGIPTEYQAQLFGQFYRVPTITLRSGTGVGLGLGLFICKTIIERHGGSIGVSSVVGQGSTFWFTLPLPGPAEQKQ